jgi:phosphoadenosine phosphosulfate reductase
MTRWCCDVLKKDPARPRKIKALVGSELRHRIMGIRAEESIRRAGRPRVDTFNGQTFFKPIFGWAEWHIWEFIESRGLAYPSLYDDGFARIGCVVCPFINSQPAKLKRHKERWPGIYRVFERVVSDWFYNFRTSKARGKYPDQTAEEYLIKYYSDRLCAPPPASRSLNTGNRLCR